MAKTGRPGAWRAALGYLLTLLGPIFAAAPLFALATATGWLDGLSRTETNLMVALGSLALAPLALWAALALLHGRSFRSLLSADGLWRWREAALGAAAAICVVGAGLGLGLATGLTEVAAIENYTPPWALLATAMLLIPAQATGEELVYRGYLLQEIGARLPFWPAWAVAPAVVFGALHYDPGATPALAIYGLLYALVFGVFAAALVWRTGAVALASGFHVMNNWIVICLFTPPLGVRGLGPIAIELPANAGWGDLAIQISLSAVLFTAAYLALSAILGRSDGAKA